MRYQWVQCPCQCVWSYFLRERWNHYRALGQWIVRYVNCDCGLLIIILFVSGSSVFSSTLLLSSTGGYDREVGSGTSALRPVSDNTYVYSTANPPGSSGSNTWVYHKNFTEFTVTVSDFVGDELVNSAIIEGVKVTEEEWLDAIEAAYDNYNVLDSQRVQGGVLPMETECVTVCSFLTTFCCCLPFLIEKRSSHTFDHYWFAGKMLERNRMVFQGPHLLRESLSRTRCDSQSGPDRGICSSGRGHFGHYCLFLASSPTSNAGSQEPSRVRTSDC